SILAFTFKLPDIGEGIHEGEIVKWFIQKGDHIEEDDPLCEVQNDKSVVEIPSPVDGEVLEIEVAEGEVAGVGDPLVRIDADGYDDEDGVESSESEEGEQQEDEQQTKQETDEKEEQSAAKSSDKPVAPTAVAVRSARMCARERGVAIDEVTGSGKN